MVVLSRVLGIVIEMQQLSKKSKYSNGAHSVPGTERGFTLVELMAVLAILSILLLVGAPTFIETIKNSRMRTETYALRSTLAAARSEAMVRRAPVRVCETSDSTSCASSSSAWNTAHLAFADVDNDGAIDAGEVFLVKEHNAPGVNITFTGDVVSEIRFSSRGDSLGFSGIFTLCDDRGATEATAVVLNNAGEVRFASDTDDDDIVDVGGSNVVCPAP